MPIHMCLFFLNFLKYCDQFLLICQKESAAALNQLSKMREQLDKKQEDLGGPLDENTPGPPGVGAGAPGQRRESIWNGLAEI